MLGEFTEMSRLVARVRTLEDTVRSLRVSRRVLMNLLAERERAQRGRIRELEKRNEQLRQDNLRYVRRVVEQNMRICALQDTETPGGSRAARK